MEEVPTPSSGLMSRYCPHIAAACSAAAALGDRQPWQLSGSSCAANQGSQRPWLALTVESWLLRARLPSASRLSGCPCSFKKDAVLIERYGPYAAACSSSRDGQREFAGGRAFFFAKSRRLRRPNVGTETAAKQLEGEEGARACDGGSLFCASDGGSLFDGSVDHFCRLTAAGSYLQPGLPSGCGCCASGSGSSTGGHACGPARRIWPWVTGAGTQPA